MKRRSENGADDDTSELRDPAFFVEAGRTYLLYSVAGVSDIAIAKVHVH